MGEGIMVWGRIGNHGRWMQAHFMRCHADEIHQVPLPEGLDAPICIQLLGHHYGIIPLVHLHLHLDTLQWGCPHINNLNKPW